MKTTSIEPSFTPIDPSAQHVDLLKQFLSDKQWFAQQQPSGVREAEKTPIKEIAVLLCTWAQNNGYKSFHVTQTSLANYLKQCGFHVTKPQNTFKADIYKRSTRPDGVDVANTLIQAQDKQDKSNSL